MKAKVLQTWVIVADSSRARIFNRAGKDTELLEIEDLAHPESRLPGHALTTDRPGRTFNSRGRTRHAMQPKRSAHEIVLQDFAQDLARRLERGRKNREFQQLILVAGPRFVGRIHQHLSPATAALVKREVHKNLVRRSEKTIRAHLK
jgi:protein required for attachment to host cells